MVRGGHHRHEWLATQREDADVVGTDRRSQESDVEAAVQQSRLLVGGEQLAVELELDARELLAQCSAQARQQLVGRGAGETEGDPADVAVGDEPRLGGRVLDRGEDVPGAIEEAKACCGRLDAACRTAQQLHAELGLKVLDLL